MTPRSLWTIIIKILGIYLLWQCLVAITQTFALTVASNSFGEPSNSLAISIAILILILGFFILLIYQCIFATGWIIDKLKLDDGFIEEKFELNIHRSTILSIAIIVIGGIILVETVPQTCVSVFDYFKHNDSYPGNSVSRYTITLVVDILKVAIGYFMATESRMIVNYIERKRKIPAKVIED